MLPLHADDPRKLAGFALLGAGLLDALEAEGRSGGWLSRALGR